MPCADNNTICARRQVTTEPLVRRTKRSSRLPSSLVIARNSTRPAILASRRSTRRKTTFAMTEKDPAPNPANVAGQSTR